MSSSTPFVQRGPQRTRKISSVWRSTDTTGPVAHRPRVVSPEMSLDSHVREGTRQKQLCGDTGGC